MIVHVIATEVGEAGSDEPQAVEAPLI